MSNIRNSVYQELITEYNKLCALYRKKVHQSIEQWNRLQHEELSRTLASVRSQIEQLRNTSAVPALFSIPDPVKA